MHNDEKGYQHQILLFLLLALVASIPLYPKASVVIIALTVLAGFVFKSKQTSIKSLIKSPAWILSIGLFIIYLIGMVYSTNQGRGWSNIESKLSLLFFPLITLLHASSYTKNKVKIIQAYLISLIMVIVGTITFAAYRYFANVYVTSSYNEPIYWGLNYFYYDKLSPMIHPSYMSFYMLTGLMLLNEFWNSFTFHKSFIFKWISTLLLICYILLLSSKAGWIGLFVYLAYYLFKEYKNKNWLQGTTLLLITLLGFYIFNIRAPKETQRIESTKVAVEKELNTNNKTPNISKTEHDGSTSRIFVWKASIETLQQNILLGYGTGDGKDALLETYQSKGFTQEFEKKLNSHNQYLTTALDVGLLGMAALISILFYGIYYGIKQKNDLLLLFSLLAALNFTVESMLETQAGIVFFCFWYCFLWLIATSICHQKKMK